MALWARLSAMFMSLKAISLLRVKVYAFEQPRVLLGNGPG